MNTPIDDRREWHKAMRDVRETIRSIARAPRYLFIALVRGYQYIVSPHLPSSCRYTPSCSTYAVEAYEHFGVVRGTILAFWRLLRCHPLGGKGYDPPRWFGELPPRYNPQEPDDSARADGQTK